MMKSRKSKNSFGKCESIKKIYNPLVKIYPVLSSEETISTPETALPEWHIGKNEMKIVEKSELLEENVTKKFLDIKNIDMCITSKEDIASLIIPDNVRSEVLLSIVKNSKYKEMKKVKQEDDFKNSVQDSSVQPLSLLSSQDNECLSLMEEFMMLNDCSLTIGKSWVGNLCSEKNVVYAVTNMDSGFEDENSLSDLENSKLEKFDLAQSVSSTSAKGEKETDSVQVLTDNLKELKFKTEKMRNEIFVIKRDFYEEDLRITRLLKETKSLKQKIEKEKHLDEYITLLTGKPEKLNSELWPFRICVKDHKEELNLIV